MDNIASRFVKIENVQTGRMLNEQVLEKEYLMELEINRELNLEVEQVIMKIKLLHQSNNAIVGNFGH